MGDWEPSLGLGTSKGAGHLQRHLWVWAGCSRAQPSEGLVMLPQPGLQELLRQVVPCNDPHDLGQGENTQVTMGTACKERRSLPM